MIIFHAILFQTIDKFAPYLARKSPTCQRSIPFLDNSVSTRVRAVQASRPLKRGCTGPASEISTPRSICEATTKMPTELVLSFLLHDIVSLRASLIEPFVLGSLGLFVSLTNGVMQDVG